MTNTFDPALLDDVVLDEIETTSRLMIAASGCSGHLSEGEVDRILGIAAGN